MIDIEKVRSVALGHAVGDALGVPVEFCTREELDADPVTDMRGFGTYPYPAGCFSDDTSMALAMLDSLSSGKIDWDDMMIKFGAWYFDDAYTPTGVTFDCGGTCATAIENCFARDLPVAECGLSGEHSNGNGSLMRMYPISLIAYRPQEKPDSTDELIDQASALTHAHERARLGCKIYTRVLHALLKTPERAAIKNALREAGALYANSPDFPHYERLCSPDFDTLPRKSIRSTGYVVDTLEAAIWCVLTTDGYQKCVCKAVNLGEDTDTVAAVAGSLAGALYGYGAIPEEWLNTLKRRAYIEDLCEKLCKAWKSPALSSPTV